MWFLSRKFRFERRAARAFGLKDYPSAIRALEDLLPIVGENPHTLHVLATCHQRRGEHQHAIAAAERGLAADPEHLPCLKLLAEAHAACAQLDAAKDYALRALALLEPRGPTAKSFTIRLQRVLGDRREQIGSEYEHREWVGWARALCEREAQGDRERSAGLNRETKGA